MTSLETTPCRNFRDESPAEPLLSLAGGIMVCDPIRERGPLVELGLAEAFEISSEELRQLPRAYTTRRILDEWLGGVTLNHKPAPGDLVLARIEKLGQHKSLHLPNGRRRILFEGDQIIVAYGHRYAPDQFEAEVPDTLEECHLVASGGVAARALSWHRTMNKPTRIKPLGLISRTPGGEPINVADAALSSSIKPRCGALPVIAVAGTAMNAGKTTTAACLVRGLTRAGFRAGYGKVTGTGAGGDPWLLRDAGAAVNLDFTDVGYVSTYKATPEEVEKVCASLVAHLQQSAIDVIVLEIADGLYQRETAQLLKTETALRLFDGLLFAAADAMGAAAGAQWLRAVGHRILAITGALTSAPLQMTEAEEATGEEIIRTQLFADPSIALKFLGRLQCRSSILEPRL